MNPKIQPAPLKDHIERAFVMSIMWSMGALLEIPERAQMETYMKENYSDINYPKQSIGTGESMFDFVVDHNGKIISDFTINIYEIILNRNILVI